MQTHLGHKYSFYWYYVFNQPMSFALPPPGAIPDFDDLESMAKRRYDVITNEFNEGVVEAEIPEKMVRFGGKLLKLLTANMPDELKPEHKKAVDQAMQIAVVVVDRALRPRYYNISLHSMEEAGTNPVSMLDYVYNWPQDYMGTRPHLSKLLETYTKPLDISEDIARDILVVGGLIFAQVDEERLNKYVSHHMVRLDDELPNWAEMMNNPDGS